MNGVSIIIPVWNEEKNITLLVERIHRNLTERGILYEIIFVNDHSTDATKQVITSLLLKYPIHLYEKTGKRGKATSLREGFSHANYDILCMIDADLQYPPEAIPLMLERIKSGADIVVANRKEKQTSFLRSFLSTSYRCLFIQLLHGITQDCQSGLKVLRKEIVERIPLQKGNWAFDLSLLLKAKQAGYRIESIDVVFEKRYQGKSKINIVSASVELCFNALQLRLQKGAVIPFHKKREQEKGKGFHYNGQEFIHHSSLSPQHTAFQRFSGLQLFIGVLLLLDVIFGLLINWHGTIEVFLAVLTTLYFADLLFNLYLVFRSFSKPAEIVISKEAIAEFEQYGESHSFISENASNNTSVYNQSRLLNKPETRYTQPTIWPSYTVFCPLYKEWQVVPQFITAMSRLSYPKDKLQVMLLLEEDDTETIAKVRAMHLPSYFDIVIVPHSLPKTKPKACNYGLQFATGEYVVIYDAEDIPDPLQLKKSVVAFAAAGEKTACVQAKLNFYNPYQNVLTRVFTAEYSLWFDLVLTGLQSIQAPIPLGGTSNHFRTNNIRKVKGWDSFNVTEDCDLGMRLVKLGYKTAIIDSITLEEANSDLANWFAQRTRWIKGYMQTYLVHMRQLGDFAKSKRKSHLITFQLVVGGKVLSMFINPVMWLITICYFLFRAHIGPFIESFFPMPVLYMGVFSLVLGNFLYMYYYMIGSAKHGHHQLVKYVVLVPLYWLAMSIAAAMAVYKLITRPHHWSKTKHGLHLTDQKAVNQAIHNVGEELIDDQLVTVGVANALSY